MPRLLGLIVLAACGGGSGEPPPTKLTDAIFEPRHNYTYDATLTIADTEVATETHLQIDWSDMTVDWVGRPFNGRVDEVQLISTTSPRAAFAQSLLHGCFEHGDFGGGWMAEPSPLDLTIETQELSIIGNVFEAGNLVEEPSLSWLLLLADLSGERFDLRTAHWVTPSQASSNTEVALRDGDAEGVATVDLHSAPHILVTDNTPYRLDWSDFTATPDLCGHDFDPLVASQLVIARLDDTDLTEVESQVIGLDHHAAELYTADVYGVTRVILSEAVDEFGSSFRGFTKTGTWLVGLRSPNSTAPAPMALAVASVL